MSIQGHSPLALPLLLHDALADGGIKDVDLWWGELDDASRAELIRLWESCADSYFGAGHVHDQPMRMRVVAAPIDSEGDTFEGFWSHDFYDYLVAHEVCYPQQKTFHVCTAQCAARRAVEAGIIPRDFECPVADAACLMKRALQISGGRSLRLSLTFAP